jgi:adenine-specific DNA-methyltransferase
MSGDDGYGIVKQHDNILVFAKDNTKLNGEEKNYNSYNNPDNDPNGDWTSGDPSAKSGSSGTYFEIINPYTKQIDLPPKGRYWAFSKETMERYIQSGRIKFKNEIKSNQRGFVFKRYKNELQSSYNSIETLFGCDNKFMNEVGNDDIINIFGMSLFDYPKPVNLIKNLIKSSTAPGDLILDFFAGSGTTGQAVMELNQEEVDKNPTQPPLKGEEARQSQEGLFDKNRNNTHHQASSAGGEEKAFGGRRFILVQLPEKIDPKKEAFKAGYKKISDITIERVRRAGEKYKSVDNGFKVLTLADNPDRENLWNLGNLNDNEFILTHLALFYGYGLNYKTEKIAEKEIYIMKSEIEKTKDAIVIMEQKPITMEDIMYLIKDYKGRYKFFSRDCALNIELTYNLLQHFKEDNVIVF